LQVEVVPFDNVSSYASNSILLILLELKLPPTDLKFMGDTSFFFDLNLPTEGTLLITSSFRVLVTTLNAVLELKGFVWTLFLPSLDSLLRFYCKASDWIVCGAQMKELLSLTLTLLMSLTEM
jgi:hypothetical protein